MKTTTIILILFCSIINAQNIENKLEIDIRGRECKGGVGLCTIETSTNKNQDIEKFYLLKISETELQLTIKTEALTIDEQKFLFGKEIKTISEIEKFFFNQDYDFELNSETINLLNLNSKKPTIKSGLYPIKLIDNKAVIILKLFSKI
ncbi:hypothetical protein G6N05_14780 [Flavobacterium sp. F372]|jgi:hypothetical protein|uniref:Uncharacterized protein n=1 Tax=Flavobacterium bernardetii TaxID=2813823 RepID=A0ABR7J058_9FLAO|nr:hypothetical protein [Flavobacterium bernardetii]MBC5835234.1 hypothetical protein [Flavobacterium bernardetii]NHF71377.1 hypothetical protein [Flavobacterium bernardetii]